MIKYLPTAAGPIGQTGQTGQTGGMGRLCTFLLTAYCACDDLVASVGGGHDVLESCVVGMGFFIFYEPCMGPVSISFVSLHLGHGLLDFLIIRAWGRCRVLLFRCTSATRFFTFL